MNDLSKSYLNQRCQIIFIETFTFENICSWSPILHYLDECHWYKLQSFSYCFLRARCGSDKQTGQWRAERWNALSKHGLIEKKLAFNTNKSKLANFTKSGKTKYKNGKKSGAYLENGSRFEYIGMYLDRKLNFVERTEVTKEKLEKIRRFFDFVILRETLISFK